jgi:hypothetical protein
VSSVCGAADGKSWCGTRTIDVYEHSTGNLLSPPFITYSESTEKLTVLITELAYCHTWDLYLRANLQGYQLSFADTLLESNFIIECESIFEMIPTLMAVETHDKSVAWTASSYTLIEDDILSIKFDIVSSDPSYNLLLGDSAVTSYTLTATSITECRSYAELANYVGTACYFLQSDDTLYTKINYMPSQPPVFTFQLTIGQVEDSGNILYSDTYQTQQVTLNVFECQLISVTAVIPETELFNYLLDGTVVTYALTTYI